MSSSHIAIKRNRPITRGIVGNELGVGNVFMTIDEEVGMGIAPNEWSELRKKEECELLGENQRIKRERERIVGVVGKGGFCSEIPFLRYDRGLVTSNQHVLYQLDSDRSHQYTVSRHHKIS